jgi:GT2 family glycosyltransferase
VRPAIVVCTKDRPERIRTVCHNIAQERPDALVMIVDASVSTATQYVCSEVRRLHRNLDLRWIRAPRPGLARQRNHAVSMCQEAGVSIVHFIDDDVELLPGYFDAIERRFASEPTLIGVGGSVQNQRIEKHVIFNRIFLLSGRYPYTILKSGRVVNPQPVHGAQRKSGTHRIDWLQGFAMSYRIEAFRSFEFDERLSGYSLGEDRDFSFRLSRSHILAIEPEARCLHHRAPENRHSGERFGFESTILLHAWVREHRKDGLSLVAFYWALLGDLIRHLIAIPTRQPGRAGDPWPYVKGVLRGLRSFGREDPYTLVKG